MCFKSDSRPLLDGINKKLSEYSEKGYVTPGEILEAMAPVTTGYNSVPEDYDWPKKPENWLETI